MSMVVRAPDVDDPVEPAHRKLIVVVGDVRCKIGREAVRPDKHFVLLSAVFGCFVPERTFFFVGHPPVGEPLDRLVDRAIVQGAFKEPHIVSNPVGFQVLPQFFDILGERVADQLPPAVRAVRLHQPVSVEVSELLRAGFDIVPVVTVLGKFHCILSLVNLKITRLERPAEFFNLVARVVHIEFAGHLVARPVERGSKAVADSAAAGIAHMHRAGGIGRDKLDLDFFPAAETGTAVGVSLREHRMHHL